MARAKTIEEAVSERFYSWAYVGPFGNAAAAVVWLSEVAPGAVSTSAMWIWAAVSAFACVAMLIPIHVRSSRRWKTDLGLPWVSILSLGLMGLAWGSTVWIETNTVTSDPTFVFGTAAILFSIVAGTYVGNTGSVYASTALLFPLGVGLASGLIVHDYVVAGVGVMAFGALTIPAFVDSARVTRELIALQIESEEIADHDPLTGLLNRRGVTRRLSRCDSSAAVALLYIDLDGFKGVNDELGHEVGDGVLQVCARRLARLGGSGDNLVARVGGDEFVLVFAGVDDLEAYKNAQSLSESVVRSLRDPIRIGSRSVQMSASAGLSFGACSQYGNGLVRDADEAMLAAKRQGGNRVTMATSSRTMRPGAPDLRLVTGGVIADLSGDRSVGTVI